MGDMADYYFEQMDDAWFAIAASNWELHFDPGEVKRWTDKKLVSSVQSNIEMCDQEVKVKIGQIFTLFDLLPQLNKYDRIFLEQVQNLWLMYENDYFVEMSNIHYNPKDYNGTI